MVQNNPSLEELFKGRHFKRDLIVLRVHRYLRSKLSCRDLAEKMAKRGVAFAYTAILHWVQRFLLTFEKRGNLQAHGCDDFGLCI